MTGFSRRWALVCALAAVACPQVSSGATITGAMHESFSDYPAGTAFVNPPPAAGQNGGPGWNTSGLGTLPNDAGASWGALLNAGVLRTVTSPGLNHTATGYLAPTGGKLTLDAQSTNVTQNIGRTLGGQTIDAGTTYFSFLVSKNTPDTQRTINLAFFNGTGEQFAVGQIGTGSGNTGGNIALLMNNSNPGGLVQSATPIAMGTDVAHLVVGRIDWNAGGNETVAIWVDPSDVTTEALAGSAYASTAGFNITGITGIRPFAGNTSGTFTGVSANFDEIRLGGTWESVTSQAIAVPEPGVGLLGMGVAGMLAGRRRRG
jgi:hypothetical protein